MSDKCGMASADCGVNISGNLCIPHSELKKRMNLKDCLGFN